MIDDSREKIKGWHASKRLSNLKYPRNERLEVITDFFSVIY
jgi:hypothetical protein